MLGSEVLSNGLHPGRRLLEPVALARPVWLRHRALVAIACSDGEERDGLVPVSEGTCRVLVHLALFHRVLVWVA